MKCSCGSVATHRVDLGSDGELRFCGRCLPSHLALGAEPIQTGTPGLPCAVLGIEGTWRGLTFTGRRGAITVSVQPMGPADPRWLVSLYGGAGSIAQGVGASIEDAERDVRAAVAAIAAAAPQIGAGA